MTLTFPNPSRSFDEVRHGVRFTGYDGVFQVPFVVEAAALFTYDSKAMMEPECLTAFDAARDLILDVARKAYTGGRRSLYTLTADDF